MPLVKIETRRSLKVAEKKNLFNAVHSALREALGILEEDRNIRFVSYSPEDFQVPPGKTLNFTLVEITLFAGRSPEAKKNLYRNIVGNLGELGISPVDVFIVLHEVPLENWGIRGGIPASEVDLGFDVQV